MKKLKTRLIEMYIGETPTGDGGSWYTDYVGIPINTPAKAIEKVAIQKAKKIYKNKLNIAFIGLYNIPPIDFPSFQIVDNVSWVYDYTKED